MTSILKVDTRQDADGNNIINESSNTITIGASGDTTNVIGTLNKDGVAVTNTPAFQAYLNANQGSISADTFTKVAFDTEEFDSDGNFDTSTSRFTPTTAGKYLCYAIVGNSFSGGSPDDLRTRFYFNGSELANMRPIQLKDYGGAGLALALTQQVQSIITFNGSSDYLEVYARNDGTPQFNSDSTFGAYRLVGV